MVTDEQIRALASAEQYLQRVVQTPIAHGEIRAYTYVEVLKHMTGFAEQQRDAALRQVREADAQMVQAIETRWRENARQADRLAGEHDARNDGANSHAFRKERRIWTTCADALALLRRSAAPATPDQET